VSSTPFTPACTTLSPLPCRLYVREGIKSKFTFFLPYTLLGEALDLDLNYKWLIPLNFPCLIQKETLKWQELSQDREGSYKIVILTLLPWQKLLSPNIGALHPSQWYLSCSR